MLVLRPAEYDDLAAVVGIHNTGLHTTTNEWTEIDHTVAEWDERLRRATAADFPVLVACAEATVVGWASYGDFRDTARWEGYGRCVEHSVHVDEQHWGRGVGRALITALADHAGARGERVMVAAIDAGNRRSIGFHSHLGFVKVAHMPGIGEKMGRSIDLVLMQHDLSEPLR